MLLLIDNYSKRIVLNHVSHNNFTSYMEKGLVSLAATTELFALNAIGKSGADPGKMVTVFRYLNRQKPSAAL